MSLRCHDVSVRDADGRRADRLPGHLSRSLGKDLADTARKKNVADQAAEGMYFYKKL
jgi:hypothetical protein